MEHKTQKQLKDSKICKKPNFRELMQKFFTARLDRLEDSFAGKDKIVTDLMFTFHDLSLEINFLNSQTEVVPTFPLTIPTKNYMIYDMNRTWGDDQISLMYSTDMSIRTGRSASLQRTMKERDKQAEDPYLTMMMMTPKVSITIDAKHNDKGKKEKDDPDNKNKKRVKKKDISSMNNLQTEPVVLKAKLSLAKDEANSKLSKSKKEPIKLFHKSSSAKKLTDYNTEKNLHIFSQNLNPRSTFRFEPKRKSQLNETRKFTLTESDSQQRIQKESGKNERKIMPLCPHKHSNAKVFNFLNNLLYSKIHSLIVKFLKPGCAIKNISRSLRKSFLEFHLGKIRAIVEKFKSNNQIAKLESMMEMEILSHKETILLSYLKHVD